jgi:fructoselysine 3-epimerase
MKLAFSTNAFGGFDVCDAIRHIAEAGYAGVEILADVPHAYPPALDRERVSRIVNAVEQTGLGVSNINVNCSFGYWADAPPEPYFEPGLISPNRRHREDRIAMIRRAMVFATEVGADCVSITSGRMTGATGPAEARRLLDESLRRLLDDAEQLNIRVGIECEPGLYLEWVDELSDWIARLGSDKLGANLDVGHCQVMGESVAGKVRQLAGRIWNLHVEGMPGRKHYHLVPGVAGDTMPWTDLRQALSDIGYDRFATIELYTMQHRPIEAARESIQFLQSTRPGGDRAGI